MPKKKLKIKRHEECVKVVVRCRLMLPFEIDEQREKIVNVDETRGEISVKNPKTRENPRQFTFDYVYGTKSHQKKIYQ